MQLPNFYIGNLDRPKWHRFLPFAKQRLRECERADNHIVEYHKNSLETISAVCFRNAGNLLKDMIF